MLRCNICFSSCESPEEVSVRSNVRKFQTELFRVWRCPTCASVHARDEVDLGHYYASYPFHSMGEHKELDPLLKATYRKQLQRLRAAGLRPEHSVLDYGCGGGAFVKFLREEGYARVRGFDEYSEHFADRSVLSEQYDVILTQDVLEHVPEPWEFLRELSRLLAPGGTVLIGTPNAEALDLQNLDSCLHALHQPYHRHIMSKQKLLTIGDELGWQLLRYYPNMYTNTRLPFLNHRFLLFYCEAGDGTVEMLMGPPRIDNWKLYTPASLFWGLFGSFFAPESDVAVVYRKP
jgi:SAM-dependent methyltransferase